MMLKKKKKNFKRLRMSYWYEFYFKIQTNKTFLIQAQRRINIEESWYEGGWCQSYCNGGCRENKIEEEIEKKKEVSTEKWIFLVCVCVCIKIMAHVSLRIHFWSNYRILFLFFSILFPSFSVRKLILVERWISEFMEATRLRVYIRMLMHA